jgi:glucokinase
MSQPLSPTQPIALNAAQPPFFAGLDLGGTNIKVGIVDDCGRVITSLSIPTLSERGPEDASQRMGQAVLKAIQQAGLTPDRVARVGLGTPGTMEIPAGKPDKPANLKGWDYFPLRDRVSAHCGLPVTFANDANAAAYGEFWVGSGRGFHSMVLLTLGTGIGCGIIIGELIVDGENSHGAECGHIIIDCCDAARVCGCGQPGHLEAYASATAVIKRTQEALAAGRPSSLSRRVAAGAEVTPKLVAEEADQGDALALELVLETARYLGIGIVSLIHTVDPSGVLLAGAMTFGGKQTELGRRFLARIQEEVRRRAFALLAERVVIDFALLGGDAGFIGAAGVARLQHKAEGGRRKGEGGAGKAE